LPLPARETLITLSQKRKERARGKEDSEDTGNTRDYNYFGRRYRRSVSSFHTSTPPLSLSSFPLQVKFNPHFGTTLAHQ
jgi:hypothetical protein